MDKDEAVRKTLEYGQQYGVVYDSEELEKRLISDQSYRLKNESPDRKVTPKSKFTMAKLKSASDFANKMARIFPDILLVAVTGSVAALYCKENDDIDLMIVTRRNRLWINRLLLRIYVSLNNIPHRKFGLKENKDDLCFNLWMEDGELKLPLKKQNLKNAMDTILMVPIIDKEDTYKNFLAENKWVEKFVKNGYSQLLGEFKARRQKKSRYFDPISILNWLVFWPQWWYMRGKISSEVVGLRSAFFHPSDRIRYARKDNR